MCPTPKPVFEFGRRVMEYFVEQQFDLVNEEIERLRKKGYIVYYKTISREEYESSNFIENARKIMQEAKETSKGWHYNGLLVFYPFVNEKNYKSLINHTKPSLFNKIFGTIFDWSIHYNEGKCLGNMLINRTGKICEDASIHLMVFYFKEGLNWK